MATSATRASECRRPLRIGVTTGHKVRTMAIVIKVLRLVTLAFSSTSRPCLRVGDVLEIRPADEACSCRSRLSLLLEEAYSSSLS
jgi:hypothetical protein